MPKPKLDLGDKVVLPHPRDIEIVGEVTKVQYSASTVAYGVRWWEGAKKHYSTFAEEELTPAE